MHRPEEAASALGVSEDYFTQHIAPSLRRYRDGRLVLYPVFELERWAAESVALPLRNWGSEEAEPRFSFGRTETPPRSWNRRGARNEGVSFDAGP